MRLRKMTLVKRVMPYEMGGAKADGKIDPPQLSTNYTATGAVTVAEDF